LPLPSVRLGGYGTGKRGKRGGGKEERGEGKKGVKEIMSYSIVDVLMMNTHSVRYGTISRKSDIDPKIWMSEGIEEKKAHLFFLDCHLTT
jgi:hypothetical protein